MDKILFLTHVGDPGGAEFKMMDFLEDPAFSQSDVLRFQSGSLDQLLATKNIGCRKVEMPESLAKFKRSDGIVKIIAKIPQALVFLRDLIKIAKEYRSLICMSQKSFLLIAIAKPFVRRPVIWFMNDLLSEEYFNKSLIRIMIAAANTGADHIVLNSEASYRAWIEAGGSSKKSSVIYPGINFSTFEDLENKRDKILKFRKQFGRQDKKLVGMFGRIAYWKGQDVFIKAMKELNGCTAVIVGEAYFDEKDYEESLRALINEYELNDRVYFAGHINEVPLAMAACDIIVHCSRHPEPFGRVIVEAMASNKPTIASKAGGATEIIENEKTGLLTKIDDHLALAQAIDRYVQSPEWAADIAELGCSDVKSRFAKSTMTEKLRSIVNAM